MHLAYIRHNADRRRSNRGKRRDLPQSAHADLHNSGEVLRHNAEQRQRQADLVIVICRCAADLPPPRENSGCEFLRRGLAVGARNRNHGDVKLHAPCMRDCLICPQSVLRFENGAFCFLQRLLGRCAQRRADNDCRRPPLERFRCKIRAVKLLSAQCDEEIARRNFARIRRDMREYHIPGKFPVMRCSADSSLHLIPCHARHCLLLIASVAVSRSSK